MDVLDLVGPIAMFGTITVVLAAVIALYLPRVGFGKAMLATTSALVLFSCLFLWLLMRSVRDPYTDSVTTADLIDLKEACYITPPPVVVDVNESVIVEAVIDLDISGCSPSSAAADGRVIEVTSTVGLQLSDGGFNGDITPVGAEDQPLDARRREAHWKWVLKPDVPGTYKLNLVATARDSTGELFAQDIRGMVEVRAEGNFGYYASQSGRWLKEAIGTTQIIAGGIAAVFATAGTVLVRKRRAIKEGRRALSRRHGLRPARQAMSFRRRSSPTRVGASRGSPFQDRPPDEGRERVDS